MDKLCDLRVPSRVTVSLTNEGVGTFQYSKTFSSFYDFNTKEKLCSLHRYARTSQLALNGSEWCLYQGGPNGKIFGQLFTGPRGENEYGLYLNWDLQIVVEQITTYPNAFPCLTVNNGLLVENSDEGILKFPRGCARLSPVNTCVFKNAYGTNQDFYYKYGQSLNLHLSKMDGDENLGSGSCMPYSGQRFPFIDQYYQESIATYTITVEP